MSEWKVPVQSLIDHIKTAVDVDPWAKEMAEELLKEQNNCENCAIAIEDRQPVVRCKDCKYGKQLFPDYISCQISDENKSGCHASHKPEWFCADGERR